MFYALIGFGIGVLLNHLIIKPIERKRIRKQCIEEGLVPKYFHNADDNNK